MRLSHRLAFAAAAFAVSCGAMHAGSLEIVSGGRSEYAIALPDDAATAAMVREAADALQGYILESTGCSLPIVRESEVGARPAFYLGRTKKGESAQVPYAKLTDYVHCRRTAGRDIFLAGNDADGGVRGPLQQHDHEYLCTKYGLNADVKDLSYRRWHGTLKAVLAFLEREGVVRFLMPGPNGRNVKKCTTLTVSAYGDFLKENAIPYSSCKCYGDLHTTVALGHLEHPRSKTWGGHSLPAAVPRSRYGKTHPEYFVLKNGVRRPVYAGASHYCVSNPDVFELYMAELKRQYDMGFRWLQVGVSDGRVDCECDVCRRMHPELGERLWTFYRKVAEAARERMPEAKMVLLSYIATSDPPKSFDSFPDNVVIELCIRKDFRRKFEDWARFRDVPKIAYLYFFGLYHSLQIAPKRSPRHLAECVRALADNGVRSVFKCGWVDDIGLEAHGAYVFSRLLEDPSRSPDEIGDEFCDLAYGKAAPHMKAFYGLMYSRLDTAAGHSVIDELSGRIVDMQTNLSPDCGRMFELAFRPHVVTGMEAALGRAERTGGLSAKESARIALAKRSFGLLKARAQCYFLQEDWDITKAPELLDVAGRLSADIDAMLGRWYGADGRMIRPDGFDWHYIHDMPKKSIVEGSSGMMPSFPPLFQGGADGWKALKTGDLAIVENGRSEYVIAVPDDADEAKKVEDAAEALHGYLKRSTGCALRIVREGDVGGAPAFYLGRTRKGGAVGVPYGRFVDYVHCRKAVGRDIFLAGNDESAGIKGELQHHDHEYLRHTYGVNKDVKDQSYRRWHGTLKAVLEFLEAEGVVKFLMPGENGLNILKRGSLSVPGGMNYVGQAQIPYSNASCYGGLHATVALGHVEIPYSKTWGGHPLPVAVPREKYEKTHPEYFILKDGVRRPDFGPARGGHHCVSNPEVFELFMAEMRRQYDLGYRWIQVGPTDGQVACECEECRRMHPSPQERQWLFYRKVAEAAKTRLPGATMVLLSYDFTADAPTSFDTFPDNVAVELCIWKNFREKFENWARFRDIPKIAYVYFFGMYHSIAIAPTRSPKYIADCMRILRDNSVKCIFKCGWAEDLGLEAPICYVFSKLLDNPDADPDKLVEEFCDAAYGKAAGPMKGFFKAMYAGMDTPGGHSVIDEFAKRPHHPEEMFEYMFRPYPVVTQMSALLGAAESANDPDPKVRARLKLVRRSYDFLRLRAQSYYLSDAYAASCGAPEVLAAAGRVYDARERLLDGWYDAKGTMIGNEGFDWHYLRNMPRERLVCGGGAMPPNFPSLFRYGPGSVKDRLEKHDVIDKQQLQRSKR